MTGNMFVYGTLMADEVLKLLLKRVPDAKPATIKGYSRYRVQRQVYPAIIPSTEDSKVNGKVLLDLTAKEFKILDVYEAEEYYRTTVQPELEDGSTVQAEVYVFGDEHRHKLKGDWQYEDWRQQHLHKWTSKLDPEGAHPSGTLDD